MWFLLQMMLLLIDVICFNVQCDDLPGWMLWLRDKLESAMTPINVKHFIARIILNTEKVRETYQNNSKHREGT